MKKRILTMLLAAGLCLGVIASLLPFAGAAYEDVTDADTARAVAVLTSMGIVEGYSDGTFRPENTLTRAQFCKLAILAGGYGGQLTSSAYKTIFEDVPAGSWASGYINLANSLGLVTGYGNGCFGPDDPVTPGQAVKVVLGLLGYTTSDVGPFFPEDYLEKGEALGLTAGVDTSSQALTRGEAAVLLYRLLGLNTKEGKAYLNTLAAAAVPDAVLLDNAATAGDGSVNTACVYAAGSLTWYGQVRTMDASLVGERGTLLLDKDGKACGFLPDGTARRTITIASIDGAGVTDGGGNTYTLSADVPVLLDETRETYENCWYDLRVGDRVTLYDTAGTVDLAVAEKTAARAAVSITGYYEDAAPNTAAPSTITVLGASLKVADEGRAALAAFSIGDKITVTLDSDGAVASACAASARSAEMVGVLTVNGARGSVALGGGVTVSGTLTNGTYYAGQLNGGLVRAAAYSAGSISVSALSATGSTGALDPAARTVGERTLSADVRLYERVGTGTVSEISLSDILVASVPAADIEYVGYNEAGEAEILLLSDVTGNCYEYGLLVVEKEEKSSAAGMSYVNTTVAVENSSGTGTAWITGMAVTDGAVGGVAGNASGKTAGLASLTKVSGLTRADFDGKESVGGIPISENVQVYNTTTKKWITLSQAKAFTDLFTIYYDRTVETGGQVRVILTE